MNARRLGLCGVTLVMLLTAGCKTQPVSSTPNNVTPGKIKAVAIAPTTGPVFETPSSAETPPLPDALARKTAAYAKTLELTSPDSQATRADPSAVHWGKPRRPKFLEPQPAAPEGANTPAVIPSPAPVAIKPAASATDTAHVTAITRSAKSNAMNDVPIIAPESADFAAPKTSAATDDLEQRLSKRATDNPRDVAAQLDYQLCELLNDESSPQLASISMLPNEDRELVAALVDGISNFRTAVRQDNNMLLSKKIRPITDMADRVRTQAELAVPTVMLCKKVDGFGKYEPIDPPRFPAGKDNPAIVYCEIENFESRLNDHREWETKLSQEVTLFTETGMLVWKDKSHPVTDECRNRRHDFFMYDMVKLPGNLSIGRYLLKVTIVDRTANRVAESTVPVEIVGQ